jgi:cysteinyl-tRNA synthetase
MSSDILGDEFDIHGGGIDLIFPHHENEIAQSEGAGKPFARSWIHNGLLTINSEKMAKSLGNFISIQDFIKDYKDADYLKLLFLNTHYRHPVDYTEEKISEMKAQKERFAIFFDKADRIAKAAGADVSAVNAAPCAAKAAGEVFRKRFEEAMDDDFNTPLALASLFDAVTFANKLMQEKDDFIGPEIEDLLTIKKLIINLSGVLGLELGVDLTKQDIDEAGVLRLVEDRNRARRNRDFKAADDIRRKLSEELGIILEDEKDGTVWRRKG